MKEKNIIKVGSSTVIMNGGNALPGCPDNWEDARKWENLSNENLPDGPKWSFDCGFKLDFDGPLISVSSRFYPPKSHYGPTWDGTVTIYFLDVEIEEKKFDCLTIEDLKTQVEQYIKSFKDRLSIKK